MEACDSFIPEPVRELDKPFLMPVEDVFTITGRGTVVTGRIERGIVKVGDELEIVGLGDTRQTVCTGVEMFRKLLDQGQAGDNVGVLLRGTKREEIERGMVLCKKGTIPPHNHFTAEVYVLKKEEGGRHTPFFNGYRPQFYFRTTDVTGTVTLPAGTEMVMPGDNIKVDVELVSPIACEEGLRFAIREGGKTVGAGVVTKILAEAVAKKKEEKAAAAGSGQEVTKRLGSRPARQIDRSAASEARDLRRIRVFLFRLLLATFCTLGVNVRFRPHSRGVSSENRS